MDMTIQIPNDVRAVLSALQKAGFKAYLVGGAVRDLLMHPENKPTDWDFTTDATPEEVLALFSESFYENEFGTVAVSRNHLREQFGLPAEEKELSNAENTRQAENSTQKVIDLESAGKIHKSLLSQPTPLMDTGSVQRADQPQITNHLQQKQIFEITTFRSDGVYKDFRRPEQVTWGKIIEDDLQRRDFTINAMAIQVSDMDHTLIDPHHGQADITAAMIRTVGDPASRFQEDALRMLRAIRLSVQLNFAIDEATWDAIIQHAGLIQHVSWERIRDEFLKMLASDFPREAIELLDQSNLLCFILPELLEAKGVEQGGHHTTDVWTHSLDALGSTPSRDPVVRLATLLHDIAKPQTFDRQHGTITFYNHEIIGARVAKNIAERLKLSKHDSQRIFLLVRHHMFYYQPENTDAAIRRFMRQVGLENINDIIDLRIGDRLGSGARETSWRFEEMKQRMQEQLHQPFAVTDLAIDGNDLMREFKLKPGPHIGKILHTLFEQVLENPELNTKAALLEKAKENLSTSV